MSLPFYSIFGNVVTILTCCTIDFCAIFNKFIQCLISLRLVLFRIDKSHHHSNVSKAIRTLLAVCHIIVQQFLGQLYPFNLLFEVLYTVRRIDVALSLLSNTIFNGP